MSVRSYVCPGEVHPISRSVHLARLAADYAKCSACPHCSDLGGIGLPVRPDRVETTLAPVLQRERLWRSLRSPGARAEILACCEALAALLWQETPWELPVNEWNAGETCGPTGPLVCVAAHPSDVAESFSTEVIRRMSRSGCRVVSLGAVSRAALDFAVDHLECSAGIWVEGGGSPAGIGIRVTGPASSAWSEGGRLGGVVEWMDGRAGRPSRIAGAVKSFEILPAYRESLVRHYGPVATELAAVGMGTVLQSTWSGLDARVACQLREACPGGRCDEAPSATLLRALQEDVVRQRMGGGVVFGADGRQAWWVDRREGLRTDRFIAERLAQELRQETGEREVRVVAAEELMWTELNAAGVRLVTCGPGEEKLVDAMRRHRALLGCDGAGRYWIARPIPRCDGLLTLAYLCRTVAAGGSALQRCA
ncbi:Phosphoglucosamine mutase [Caulifigura coniformis]|uniref:Phosphoglucosamine mutase n=1 Tax=Caulifigura coniformis TaxID=2527983 RepID=A0A517SJ49_9PLAN|nr:hypothetical protein [Caulifigura coniformis]QDT56139.1 Phosphoglucosamine mutase [Caulifigura coniformis]